MARQTKMFLFGFFINVLRFLAIYSDGYETNGRILSKSYITTLNQSSSANLLKEAEQIINSQLAIQLVYFLFFSSFENLIKELMAPYVIFKKFNFFLELCSFAITLLTKEMNTLKVYAVVSALPIEDMIPSEASGQPTKQNFILVSITSIIFSIPLTETILAKVSCHISMLDSDLTSNLYN